MKFIELGFQEHALARVAARLLVGDATSYRYHLADGSVALRDSDEPA